MKSNCHIQADLCLFLFFPGPSSEYRLFVMLSASYTSWGAARDIHQLRVLLSLVCVCMCARVCVLVACVRKRQEELLFTWAYTLDLWQKKWRGKFIFGACGLVVPVPFSFTRQWRHISGTHEFMNKPSSLNYSYFYSVLGSFCFFMWLGMICKHLHNDRGKRWYST